MHVSQASVSAAFQVVHAPVTAVHNDLAAFK